MKEVLCKTSNLCFQKEVCRIYGLDKLGSVIQYMSSFSGAEPLRCPVAFVAFEKKKQKGCS